MAVETNPIGILKTGVERSWSSIKSKIPFLQKEQQVPTLGIRVISDTESREVTNPFQTLDNLRIKANIMADMMENKIVEQPYIGRMRFWVRSWFSCLFKDGRIEGLENLHSAISTAEVTGKRIILTPAHLADADHSAALYLLSRRDHLLSRVPLLSRLLAPLVKILGVKSRGLGIEDELFFMGGTNMQKRSGIKQFMRAESVIYGVTSRDWDHLQTLIERKDEYGFDEQQIQTQAEVKQIFTAMRKQTMEQITETCVQEKKPLVGYVEGGRSSDGLLDPPVADFSILFPRDDSAIVIPYRIYGTREFNPPGVEVKTGILGILRKEIFFPWLRHRVSMAFGESYPSKEIWEVWKQRREEERGVNEEKIKINPMEWVAANIASLDWDCVRPEEHPLYKRLMDKYAPGRNVNFRLQARAA